MAPIPAIANGGPRREAAGNPEPARPVPLGVGSQPPRFSTPSAHELLGRAQATVDAVWLASRPTGHPDGGDMTVLSQAELRIRPGRRDEFLASARALEAAAAGEDGTLRYAWFVGDDPDVAVAIEEYSDGAAALVHNELCAELLAQAFDAADLVAIRLYGDLGPDLTAWAIGRPTVHAHPPLFDARGG
jgi:quinol monooxygenase YgiN